MSRRCAWPCLALLVAAFSATSARAVTAPIYKCFDKHLAIVYTDLPCKDGEQIDIRAGDADPAAVERLEREREMLDQSAAQRMFDERHAAQRQTSVAPAEDMGPSQQEGPGYGGYGYGGYGYLAYPTYLMRPMHHRHRRHPEFHARGGAPSPPHKIPRQ